MLYDITLFTKASCNTYLVTVKIHSLEKCMSKRV